MIYRLFYPKNLDRWDQTDLMYLHILPEKILDKMYPEYYFMVYEGNIDDEGLPVEGVLEKIFSLHNSEKNPLSETKYQNLIRDNNSHTSMSVGDIVELQSGKWQVSSCGFTKI